MEKDLVIPAATESAQHTIARPEFAHHPITRPGFNDDEALEPADSTLSSSASSVVGPDVEKDASLGLTRTISEAYSVFTPSQKRLIVLLVGIASFFSPLSANIYFPALTSLSNQLNVSTELINLTITSYMIFQAIAPTIFGGLADSLGRRPIYILTFTIYLGANVGLALQRSYPALLVLRMLQSTGSSGVIALGNGVVADIAHAGERGMYIGAVNIGAMCGPAIGPVVGGIMDSQLGWWWIFWLLVILSGTFLVVLILFFPETGRKVVGNGSVPPRGINISIAQLVRRRPTPPGVSPPVKPKWTWPNPLECVKLILQPDMALVLFVNSIFYTAFYCVTASLPTIFEDIYGYDSLKIGLCYIPFGVGCALASIISGKIIDRDYRAIARAEGIEMNKKKGDNMETFPIERARLRSVFWMLAIYVAVLVSYGWVLVSRTSLAAPLVLQFLIGVFGTGVFNILSTFVVDLYPLKPSSATACNNLVRCLMGAGGTAVIESMLDAMGRGWCFTFVGLVCAAMTPLLMLERKKGMGWRLERIRRARERGGMK